MNLYGYATMNFAEEIAFWYDLRNRLRSDFIRCIEEGQSFPSIRQRMLDRAEDMVAQMERLKRSALPDQSVPHASPTDHPHRDTSRGDSPSLELELVT